VGCGVIWEFGREPSTVRTLHFNSAVTDGVTIIRGLVQSSGFFVQRLHERGQLLALRRHFTLSTADEITRA